MAMAQTYKLPPVSSFPTLSDAELTDALGHLFEPCPALNALVLSRIDRSKGYAAYAEFIDDVAALLFALKGDGGDAETQLVEILGAHPRLGAKKVDSIHSRGEQASLATSSSDEAEKLANLNAEYEKTFPGLRYVVFVNGRSRPVIMENMKERIARGDIEAEKKEAIKAMRDIAKDRASKLV